MSSSPAVLFMLVQVQEAVHDPREFMREGFSLAPVTMNEELLRSPAGEGSVRLVEIDISSDMWLG